MKKNYSRFVILFLMLLVTVFLSVPHAFAQQAVTPTLYCVGGNGQPPCAPINSPTASVAPVTGATTPGASSPTPVSSETTSTPSTSPTIDPCASDSTTSALSGKHRRKG